MRLRVRHLASSEETNFQRLGAWVKSSAWLSGGSRQLW